MYLVVCNQKNYVFSAHSKLLYYIHWREYHVFVLMFADEIQRRAFSKLFFYVKIRNCTVFCYEML